MREIATDAFLVYFIVWYLPSLLIKQYNTVVKKYRDWKNPPKQKHTLDLRNKDNIHKKARQKRSDKVRNNRFGSRH